MSQSDTRAESLNSSDSTQDRNNLYLAAALNWLRLRLRRLAGPVPVPAATSPAKPEQRDRASFVELFLKPRKSPTEESARLALPAPSQEISDEMIAQAEQNMLALEELNPPPALTQLAQRFGLTRFESNVVLLCVAVEIDPDIARDCARIQADPQRPFPTFAVAMALFEEPHWDAMSPERPLRYWPLIEMNQPGAQSFTMSPLRVDERILNFVKGLNYLDDRLNPLVTPIDPYDGELPPSQQESVEFILSVFDQSLPFQSLPLIQLLGSDPTSKRLVAQRAAAELGMQVYRLPAEMLPAHAGELDTLTRLWLRESALLPLLLYLEAPGPERGEHSDELTNRLKRFLHRSTGLCFLDTRENWPALSHRSYTVEIEKPLPVEQAVIWSAVLGPWAGENPRLLSAQFNLNLLMIRTIASRAMSEELSSSFAGQEYIPTTERETVLESKTQKLLDERLWRACLDNTRPQLEALAQRIDTRATWRDIVLPSQEEALLHEIAGQVGVRSQVYDDWGFRGKMNRGLGINALFAGPSGTGKTMAAEVIANDLGLYLYRIDLSAVVSKYIGETEKNLRHLFDAAEDSGAILFFDEADALFGKRSEVKDSHDRYANIEINYLLQRMEAYRGLAILATNMKSALDTAFLRRLRFIVNFPFPASAQRSEIWRKAFPKAMPLAKDDWARLDYDRLAQLNLTGGSIHNIALNAAFLAARQPKEPRELTMELVLQAAQNEFRKLGITVNTADFRLPPKPAPELNPGVLL